jgi:eukaryotic-like serine/threonine-protein kinase
MREGAHFCTHCGTRTAFEQSAPTAERGSGADAVPPTVVTTGSLIGRVVDGKYEIISPLGEGGMGAVYVARRVLIGDEVAVKVLHTSLASDDTFVERFRREARAAAQLHHPNVVTIHDYGESHGAGGFAYIVMELVRGESLRDLLRREGRLEATRAVTLMRDICAGVGAAHRRGIVHRDIKPDNIIVMPADEDSATERVKVVDFGIAKLRDMAHDATLTQAGAMVGTPFYMSPEQCKGEHLDARADVYSLGALLYEMLAGGPPFVSPSLTGIILKHINEPPPPMPQELRVPPALQAAVMRALAKDPNARQADATEFARDLYAALAQAPATLIAPPPQPTAALLDHSKRHAPGTQPQSQQPSAGAQQQNRAAPPQQNQSAPPQQPFYPAAPQQQAYNAQQAYAAPQRRRSRAPLVIALVVVAVAAVSGIAVVGLILLSRNIDSSNRAVVRNVNARANANLNANARQFATPTPEISEGNSNFASNENDEADDDEEDLTADDLDLPGEAPTRAEQKILAGEPLTPEDLRGLSQAQLRILRNTIYARYGRSFETPALQAYFLTRPWYRERSDYNDRMLNATDRANAELIKSHEESRSPSQHEEGRRPPLHKR